ncbi:MAG: Asp23/Gls24 family envelope stress response protein [Corynebacterium sp.]|uniref:Asp23/Gls24 family envelope stress response protein n=1 Tax=Corynebacterium sp. TaxID=1720 RepID=UPI0026DEF8E0|nr:Asp23/Gls24 family envelope stress response protein [Corynebacterium sp.]MDO5671171.1 Asp23/Gls24 family envelope stress response protein [Corynebacterium sp.]
MGIRISDRAVSRIVAAAAASVPGTTELGRSLVRLAGRTYPRYDVIVDDAAGTCSIEAFIAVIWPSPVTTVAEAVRRTVATWVEDMTGLKVTRVNVVVGPVIPGVPVTAPLIDAHPAHPSLRPVTVPPPLPLRPVGVRSAAQPVRSPRVR